MQSTYSYASSIKVNVTSTSSIPGTISSVHTSLQAQTNQVFVGPVESSFYYLMTPSLFISYVSDFQSNVTGYHVAEYLNPSPGSIYSVDELALAFQLGVTVYLTQSNSGLYTERYLIQTFILLLSAILGAIAGLMGAISFIMSFVEKHYSQDLMKFKLRK